MNNDFFDKLICAFRNLDSQNIIIKGINKKQRMFFLLLLAIAFDKPIVYVFKTNDELFDNEEKLENIICNKSLVKEGDFMMDTVSLETAYNRMLALSSYIEKEEQYKIKTINENLLKEYIDDPKKQIFDEILKNKVIIFTTAEALLQPLPKSYQKSSQKLYINQQIDIMFLESKLVEIGYEKSESLDYFGQFVRRGDILDIYAQKTYRFTFLFDQIESISLINLQTYLSMQKLDTAIIYPLYKNMNKIVQDETTSVLDFFKNAIFVFDDAKAIYDELQRKNDLYKNFEQEFPKFNCIDIAKELKEKQNNNIAFENFLDTKLLDNYSTFDFGAYNILCDQKFALQKKNTIKKFEEKIDKNYIFNNFVVNDLVVHEKHGIGRYEGIENLEIDGKGRDYIKIQYFGNDLLRIPVENIDSITKYRSNKKIVKLNKIGGVEFDKIKRKAKQSAKKLAIDLIAIYRDRQRGRGHKYNKDNSMLYEFAKTFEYEATRDQEIAVAEAVSDLIEGKIMDRLLIGDVGYGKTEVAYRVAFKVICENKQVAFLCPTTILAMQHYETIKDRYKKWGINVAVLTRNSDTKDILDKLKTGEIDMIIGTHRLLSNDVVFHDIGLLIIDEEQRFGVEHKDKIKDKIRDINVLALSATPIPRTLHLSLINVRDISVISTPPKHRLAVESIVCKYSDKLLVEVVNRELDREGKVFIVYNDVKNMAKFCAKVASLIKKSKIAFAHGQMEKDTLQNNINDFSKGNANVLIASTIIENGIDVPIANTMIIIDSQKFGLSQLYQLRGRIGRKDRQAYVYFTYDEKKYITEKAEKRLDALSTYTELGSSFKLAYDDMEIRGVGNVLGKEQHGDMIKVGYDYYMQLLQHAIKGEYDTDDIKEVVVKIDFDTHVPDKYIKNTAEKMKLYRNISKIDNLEKREELIATLKDIFGYPPKPVLNLITVGLIKNLARKCNCEQVRLVKNTAKLKIEKNIIEFESFKELINFLLQNKPKNK